jgi:predicted GIY-YIG superfamily endonuclease
MPRKPPILVFKGHTVFILECADGSYFSGITSDLKSKLKEINSGEHGFYFMGHPDRLPIKRVAFKEEHLPFREAYLKHLYLRSLNRSCRTKMIQTGKWPIRRLGIG